MYKNTYEQKDFLDEWETTVCNNEGFQEEYTESHYSSPPPPIQTGS